MTKKWSEVVESPEYKKLSEGERANAQIQYFKEVVAPNVPEEERIAVRNQFFSEFSPWEKFDPAKDMNILEKAWVGFGSTLPTISRGAKQLLAGSPDANPEMFIGTSMPQGEKRQALAEQIKRERQSNITGIQSDIDEAKRVEAPLGVPGMVGKAVGIIGMSAPTLAVAPTVPAQAAAGALVAGAQPVASDESRLLNTVAGGAGGAAGQYVGGTLIPKAVSAAKAKINANALAKSQNAARDKTLQEAAGAGYVVPPSETNPTALSNVMERWAGKASVSQEASKRNQQITNDLARVEIGLAKDQPITPETLLPLKQAAWDVYDKMKSLGTFTADATYRRQLAAIKREHGGSLVKRSGIDEVVEAVKLDELKADDVIETIKQLRADASANLSPLSRDAATKALGRAQKAVANALEDLTERNIAPARTGAKMIKEFLDARTQLAKIGTVEKAMIESTGDVDAAVFARELAKKKPLTGGLRQIGEFSQATKNRYTQRGVNATVGGSPLDTAAALGTAAVTQDPKWLALAMARPAARKLVLSDMMRRSPKYDAGTLANNLYRMSNLSDDFARTYPRLSKIQDPRTLALLSSVYASQQ